MFSRFRKDDSLSSSQTPADRDLSPEESVPEHSQNPAPVASDPAQADASTPVSAAQEGGAQKHAPAGPSRSAEAVPKPQPRANDSSQSVAVPTDDVGPRTGSPAARGEQAELEASHADEAKAGSGDPAAEQAPVTPAAETAAEGDAEAPLAGLTGRQRKRRLKGRRLTKPAEAATGEGGKQASLTPEQRLLLLDTWQRSGLPAKDFAALVGLSKHTLYKWKQRFDQQGPAGLMDQPRGARRGSRLPKLTKRTILMIKQQHPDWGCQRISDMLLRGPALPASASAVARVLHEAGYEAVEEPTRPHRPKKCRFERARPNQLWQTDLFTFVLKRQNRRLYMVAFLDDHSRFLVSYGVHASASTALVIEALEAGLAAWGPPEEILTDNGPQYVTWRGKSRFTRHLEKRGIRQIVARPRHPATLGKIERFWGTMWREFLETAVFEDLADARIRIGHFVDYYNLLRPHRGLDGLVPADRFFGAAPDVLQTLKERVAANALELARHGQPKAPFYVTGQVDGQLFSVHAEGERLILKKDGHGRQEIELAGASPSPEAPDASTDPARADGPPEKGSESATDHPGPLPVCPTSAPSDRPDEPASSAPPAPGQRVLDEQCLQQELDAAGEDAASERSETAEGDAEEGGAS